MIRKSSLALMLLLYVVQILSYTIPTHAYDTSNKNQGKVVTSPKVDTSIPWWFKPMETDNLNDRLDILPKNLQKYRTSTQFLVIPAMGMVTPIVELGHDNPDRKLATKWGNFDYNKYLVAWPTIYPGTASVGSPWNTFVFAHSNYRYDKPGDFKTIFRLTYNIEKWDIMRYFKKSGTTWKKYTYQVTKSMLINETDVWIMFPEKWKTELTLSACRPIGTAKQRWVNRATLIDSKAIDYEIRTTSSATPWWNKPTIQEPDKKTWNSSWESSSESSLWILYNPIAMRVAWVREAVIVAFETIQRIGMTQ